MNDSLLKSESIFIPLDSSLHTMLSESEGNSSCEEQNGNQILLTQEEAMRLLHIAASIIQSNFKSFVQQKYYKRALQEHKSAIKIQAFWRGYRTRNLDLKVMRLKHEYLIQQFQNYFLAELETKSIFAESLLNLSSKVEELSLKSTTRNLKNTVSSDDERKSIVFNGNAVGNTKTTVDYDENIQIDDRFIGIEKASQLHTLTNDEGIVKEDDTVLMEKVKDQHIYDEHLLNESIDSVENFKDGKNSPVDVQKIVISLISDDEN